MPKRTRPHTRVRICYVAVCALALVGCTPPTARQLTDYASATTAPRVTTPTPTRSLEDVFVSAPDATATPFDMSTLPAGGYIAFSKADPASEHRYDLFLLSLHDRTVTPLLQGADHVRVSPDRSKIAYLDDSGSLHVIDATTQQQLAYTQDCSSTTWSPDSLFILCDGDNELMLQPAMGGHPIPIAACGPNVEDMNDCTHSEWSPDGYYIASWRMSAPGGEFQNLRWDLFILHLSCEKSWANCVTTVRGPFGSPYDYCAWLYDSRRFLCNEGSHENLQVLYVPSGEWTSLEGNPCADHSNVAPSPSGPHFACDFAGDSGLPALGIGVSSLDGRDRTLLLADTNAHVEFWLDIP